MSPFVLDSTLREDVQKQQTGPSAEGSCTLTQNVIRPIPSCSMALDSMGKP